MSFQTVLFISVCVLGRIQQVKAACGTFNWPTPTELTASGNITYIESLNYPSPYVSDGRCAWHVTTSGTTDSKIIIHVRDFSTEGTKTPCSKDYATIYNGADDSGTEIFRVCPGTSNERKVYISDTNEIYVTFESDGHLTYSGFQIAVFTNDTSNQPDCGTTLTATTSPQYLLSNNLALPYTASYECINNFVLEDDTAHNGIQLLFYFLDIESSAGCTVAAATISLFEDNTQYIAYTLCETADTFTEASYNIKGGNTTINFTTSASINTTMDFYGFFIEYQTTFVGLFLSQPDYNATVNLTVSELTQIGNLDTENGVINANATGVLSFTITESGATSTMFGIDSDATPIHYLTLVGILDFETTPFYSLTILLASSDAPAPADTATVFFNITVEDADDLAPVFQNLPSDIEILRSRKTGDSIFTLNATDFDGTSPNFTTVVYQFFNEPLNFFTLNGTSGEITLDVDADQIHISITNYQITCIAHSVSIGSGLSSTGLLNITIPPDSPPVCTSTYVYAETLEAPFSSASTTAPYVTSWNCTDEYNITYSLGSVSPNLSTTLFAVNSDTALISLVRSFTALEVPLRKFYLEIVATDSINQTTNFTAQINVTNVVCLPTPRKLYARMDAEVGSVVLYDFNCTSTVGMSYNLTQFPANTFSLSYEQDGIPSVILNTPVYKIRFYSLSVFMTNGLDEQTLNFQVTVQFQKCSIPP